jgi:hypothetical protein
MELVETSVPFSFYVFNVMEADSAKETFIFRHIYKTVTTPTVTFVKPLCPFVHLSIRLHGTTQLPWDGL